MIKNIKEAATLAAYKSSFIPDHPFEVAVHFSWGVLSHFEVYKTIPGKGTYWDMNLKAGEWFLHGQKMKFNTDKPGGGWSHGCGDFHTYIMESTERDFICRVERALRVSILRYEEQLNKELKKYKTGLKELKQWH